MMSKYTNEQLFGYLRHLDKDCFAVQITQIEQELIRRGVQVPAWVYQP